MKNDELQQQNHPHKGPRKSDNLFGLTTRKFVSIFVQSLVNNFKAMTWITWSYRLESERNSAGWTSGNVHSHTAWVFTLLERQFHLLDSCHIHIGMSPFLITYLKFVKLISLRLLLLPQISLYLVITSTTFYCCLCFDGDFRFSFVCDPKRRFVHSGAINCWCKKNELTILWVVIQTMYKAGYLRFVIMQKRERKSPEIYLILCA